MKQQRTALMVLAVIIVGALVWQQTAMAPHLEEDAQSTSTSSTEFGTSTQPIASDPEPELPPVGGPAEEGVACTMDAKLCPDGSYVGRTGPDCSFAACPNDPPATPKTVTCTPEMSAADVCPAIYAPVCGLVQVQCITTPCNPIPETFSNGCSACAQGNVISYTEGACEAE